MPPFRRTDRPASGLPSPRPPVPGIGPRSVGPEYQGANNSAQDSNRPDYSAAIRIMGGRPYLDQPMMTHEKVMAPPASAGQTSGGQVPNWSGPPLPSRPGLPTYSVADPSRASIPPLVSPPSVGGSGSSAAYGPTPLVNKGNPYEAYLLSSALFTGKFFG